MGPRVVALLGALVLLGGCGGDDEAAAPTTAAAPVVSAEAQVRATFRSAAAAAASGNGTVFCSKVAPEGKAKLTARTSLSCVNSIQLLATQLTPADRVAITGAKITGVTVTGDSAVVTYDAPAKLAKLGFTGTTKLTNASGQWLVLGI